MTTEPTREHWVHTQQREPTRTLGMNADSRLEPPRMCTHLHSRVPTSIRGWEQHDVLSKEVLCVCYVGWLGRAITCQYLCTLRLNGVMSFWLKGQRWGEEISLPLELACCDLSLFGAGSLKAMAWAEGGGDFWHQQWCLSTPLTAWAAASQVPLAMVAGLRMSGVS